MKDEFDAPVLFVVNDVPVKVKPTVLVDLIAGCAVMSYLTGRSHPQRSWPERVLVGSVAMSLWVIADLGHALAHTVSARKAGAPMDEIQVSEGMPRTIYFDNDVSPQAHRMRALGGPIYSALGLSTSLALRVATPKDSLAHELAGWSVLGQSFIFLGSLAPLPIVDGGSILKWTLVERGQTPEEAEQVVERTGLVAGAAALGASAALAAKRKWLPALGMLAAGGVAIAASLGKIK